ncbi:MAG: 30S ribosomal protein S3 [Candidatus Zixiibacteriota bacterium]
MGQKSHPIATRLGISRGWNSNWFSQGKDFVTNLQEDIKIREYTLTRLDDADVSSVEILRSPKRVVINVYTARPGIVIGKSGIRVEGFKKELEHLTSKEIQLNVLEINKPELDAYLVSKNIARQLEGRVNHRRAMKRAITQSMRMGAKGIKIICRGRLRGAEIAHHEAYQEGLVPLHTYRAKIDYAKTTAHTTYGSVGVKVWICKGEVLGGMREVLEMEEFAAKKRQKRSRGGGGKRRPRSGSRRR